MRHLAFSASLNRMFSRLNFPVSITETPYTASFDLITRHSLNFAAFGAVVALNLALQPVIDEISSITEYAFFIGIYFVLVPAGFFLPFWQARSKLVEARKRVMENLTTRLQLEYEHLLSIQRKGEDPNLADESLARLRNLQETIQITDTAPTWPFGLISVYRLSATVVLPFIFTFFNLLTGFRDFFRDFLGR